MSVETFGAIPDKKKERVKFTTFPMIQVSTNAPCHFQKDLYSWHTQFTCMYL